MRVGAYSVESGDRVEIWRDGVLLASGRWSGGHIAERRGSLGAEGDAAADWAAIERAIKEEAEALVASSIAAAYDARGVDVTQIDRMLSLSPRERLEVLETHRRSILRLLGDGPRD